ncbi:phosphatase PAP2 family protein [Candidatus Babeliales bacterium]|nr:phosphatase PAP2 family protein [Candidatus Babeliales bacterium]
MKKSFLFLTSIIFLIHQNISLAEQREQKKTVIRSIKKVVTPQNVNNFLRNAYVDSYNIWKKIVSLDSMKVLTVVTPFYLIGRNSDAKVHSKFYDASTHTNKHQPSKFLKTFLYDEVMSAPIVFSYVVGLLSEDAVTRRFAQIFGTGLVWAWASKVFVKNVFKTDANLRPGSAEFSHHQRTHGGNPSGHTTQATYLATMLWLYKGPKYGVPLSLYATAIAGMSVAINHHYLSQVIAGAGCGALFGIAAYSVFSDWKLPENLTVSLDVNNQAQLGLKIAYNF